MKCIKCGAKAENGLTTSVTDLGSCLVIVRNVPCYKCSECNEISYTAVTVKKLEQIADSCKKAIQDIAVIDFSKTA